ncbi:TetR/AcrR family transcriptional regulator [Adhaeribacter radiodurans]|uniref:TetR/AcrR family transcriptional regulator n=1 Tax=Adhaeribacter radiodurans TaxID=2745197 RepID=A0A7L7L356_9BACT|nr:TetR/AcrR family transcriptional regulator [Adhaeribacter radiodurans]QMU26869.1 TetR/AcrR family transcriptional regulator [Adhaeribacter radiodurans]
MTNCFLVPEEKLKEAAKKVFLEKGFDGTTTRDIAQEAGMNVALLNYYFRSKEKLFSLVFNELLELNFRGMLHIMNQPIPLKDKITGLIDHDFHIFRCNPGLVTFLQNELHRNPDRFLDAISFEKGRLTTVFGQQLQEAIDAGEVRPITIPHVLQLIAANVQYIFQSKVMATRLWQMTEEEFDQHLTEHQKIVKDMICNYLFIAKPD